MASSGTGFGFDKIVRDGFNHPTQANRLTDSPSWSLYNMTGIIADRDIPMTGKVFFEVANGTPYGSYGGQGFFNPDFFSLSGDAEIGGTNSGNADSNLSESMRRTSTGNSAGNSRYCLGTDNNNGSFGYYDPGGATRHVSITRANGSSLYSSGYAACFAFALDFDNKRVWIGVSDYTSATSWYWFGHAGGGANPETASTGIDMTEWIATNGGSEARMQFFHGANDTSGDHFCKLNPGTDPTFGGLISQGGGNTDANGFGNYMHPLPAGYRGLMSASEPTSAAIDPAETDDDYPQKQFGILLYTGNATTGQTVSGLGFKPDLVWAKMRSSSQNNQLYDSSRLNSRNTPFMLRADTNGAEADDQSTGNNNEIISSFDTDGFTLGGSGSGPNDSGRTYVAWCWRANGGTLTTNDASATGIGTIDSSYQANVAGGFSIVTWTGTGSAGTIAHGLSAVPRFILCKYRNSATNWVTYHPNQGANGLQGELGYMHLEHNQAFSDYNLIWNDTAPTSTVFSVSTASNVNSNGGTYVAYCWAEVPGFSKFGKFLGCGTDNFGPKVTTGFKPELVVIKNRGASENWTVWDAARSGRTNPVEDRLQWNNTSAEATSSSSKVDFHANGFRPILNNSEINGNDGIYIYAAWGSTPYKYSLAF